MNKLADELTTRFGKRDISAASRLLWLSVREAFIIYDSPCR